MWNYILGKGTISYFNLLYCVELYTGKRYNILLEPSVLCGIIYWEKVQYLTRTFCIVWNYILEKGTISYFNLLYCVELYTGKRYNILLEPAVLCGIIYWEKVQYLTRTFCIVWNYILEKGTISYFNLLYCVELYTGKRYNILLEPSVLCGIIYWEKVQYLTRTFCIVWNYILEKGTISYFNLLYCVELYTGKRYNILLEPSVLCGIIYWENVQYLTRTFCIVWNYILGKGNILLEPSVLCGIIYWEKVQYLTRTFCIVWNYILGKRTISY